MHYTQTGKGKANEKKLRKARKMIEMPIAVEIMRFIYLYTQLWETEEKGSQSGLRIGANLTS